MRLNNRVVLVTGAAGGIGRAIALLFSDEGARVIAADIDETGGASTASEIHSHGGRCFFRRSDVSIESEVEDLLAAATCHFGQSVDVLVNVVGIAHESPAHLLSLSDWDRVLRVNLTSMFLCAKHVLPAMLASRHGAIVNISSVQALFGFPGYPHYAASKGAIISLTRQMAREYASEGIRVNCIAPGTVETPLNLQVLERSADPSQLRALWEKIHPLGRLGRPLDIAHGALFFACDESSWITGQCLAIDGGLSSAVL